MVGIVYLFGFMELMKKTLMGRFSNFITMNNCGMLKCMNFELPFQRDGCVQWNL